MPFIFNFPFNDEVEASLTAAGNKKQQAYEHKSAKDGSKNAATDGRKMNVPKEAKNTKVAVKPIEKPVQPTDIRAAATGPTPPGVPSIPPATKSATSQTPLSAPAAVDQPSISGELSWDDHKQLPGKSTQLQLPRKGEDDDDNNKKLLNDLDSRGKPEQKGPKDTGKLILKMRLHCKGCNDKVWQAVTKFEGVVAVALDPESDLVTVTGTVNREKLVSHLEQKLKQEIEVVPPAGPGIDGEAAPVTGRQDMRWQKQEVAAADDDGHRKVEEDAGIAARQEIGQPTLLESVKVRKEEPGQSTSNTGAGQGRESDSDLLNISSTLILRIRLHCDGCIDKIREAIKRFKGVESVKFRRKSDLVAVAGNMDMRELVPYLESKLKLKVEVVPGRNSSASVDENHQGQPHPACGKIHPVAGSAGGESPVQRATLATPQPTYEKDASGKGNSGGGTINELPAPVGWSDGGTINELPASEGWSDGMPCALYNSLYQNRAIDMLSDENANGCSIM